MSSTETLFVLNSKPNDPNSYIFQAIVRALKTEYIGKVVEINTGQLAQIQKLEIKKDLLVYGGEEFESISKEINIQSFRKRAIWFTEDPYELHNNKKVANQFHKVFTNDSGSLMEYKNAVYLPLAVDPIFCPSWIKNSQKNILFFSGTGWPNRKELLVDLLNKTPKEITLDLHIVPNNIVENSTFDKMKFRKLNLEHPIAISEFSLRAANSISTLVIGRNFSGSGNNRYANSPGPRLFEAGITGSCQLVHAEEIKDMPISMIENIHYLRFGTTKELVEILISIHRDPEPYLKIGNAMANIIKTEHTYKHRVKKILNELNNLPPEEAYTNSSKLNRILFISHERTKAGFNYGGAGICLDKIISQAPVNTEIRILCPSGDNGNQFDIFNIRGEKVDGFYCSEIVSEFVLHHPELEKNLESYLQRWQPDIVHINHLLSYTPGIIPIARKSGSQVVITLHDYYVLCDSWNLLNEQHRFCNISSFFYGNCNNCTIQRRKEFISVDPFRRRIIMAECLAYANHIIYPSETAKKLICSIFTHLDFGAIIQPKFNDYSYSIKASEGEDLIVLVPGNLSINKGYEDLREIIQTLEELSVKIKFKILGRVDPWIANELKIFKSVELLGRYKSNDFAKKADGCDIALFLSPWPETYCITFDEWKNSGRACYYNGIGAVIEAERQQNLHPASICFLDRSVDEVIALLIRATSKQALSELRQEMPVKSSYSKDSITFGESHWLLYENLLMNRSDKLPPTWQPKQYEKWVQPPLNKMSAHHIATNKITRAKIKKLIINLPMARYLIRAIRSKTGW